MNLKFIEVQDTDSSSIPMHASRMFSQYYESHTENIRIIQRKTVHIYE